MYTTTTTTTTVGQSSGSRFPLVTREKFAPVTEDDDDAEESGADDACVWKSGEAEGTEEHLLLP